MLIPFRKHFNLRKTIIPYHFLEICMTRTFLQNLKIRENKIYPCFPNT